MTYATSQAKRDAMRAYRQTPEGRAAANRANVAHRARYRERQKARDAVKRAILAGRIVPQCCERCGDPKAEAHHPNYKRPLLIEWLCDVDHKAAHREMRAAAKAARTKPRGRRTRTNKPFSRGRLCDLFASLMKAHHE